MSPHILPADNAVISPGNWPESSAFVLIRIRRLAILYKGVEGILIVAKDVLRQDSDSRLLSSSLCSTLSFLSGVQVEKNGTEN